MKPISYGSTKIACYLGYVTQAIVINLPSLLYVTFRREFGVSLDKIGLLVAINFIVQILVDFFATQLGNRLSYRVGAVAAHVFAVSGLLLLGVLPDVMPDPFIGLLLASTLMSIGGGLVEVIVSPLVDALPGDEKAGAMSLLHSFYCWGFVATVLLSTLFFALFSMERWRLLPALWALLPLTAFFLFLFVPIPAMAAETDGHAMSLRRLFGNRMMWVLMLVMVCSGASEVSLSQWASLFAETGLGVSKTMGDLLGPCLFAVLMGCSRLYFARQGATRNLLRSLALCGIGCVIGYLVIIFSPWPFVSLLGFGICGFSVGLMWPGTLSLSSAKFRAGGTAMFALLALCGDLGCSSGPGLVGAVSGALQSRGLSLTVSLKGGMAAALVFPLLLLLGLWLLYRKEKGRKTEESSLQTQDESV